MDNEQSGTNKYPLVRKIVTGVAILVAVLAVLLLYPVAIELLNSDANHADENEGHVSTEGNGPSSPVSSSNLAESMTRNFFEDFCEANNKAGLQFDTNYNSERPYLVEGLLLLKEDADEDGDWYDFAVTVRLGSRRAIIGTIVLDKSRGQSRQKSDWQYYPTTYVEPDSSEVYEIPEDQQNVQTLMNLFENRYQP